MDNLIVNYVPNQMDSFEFRQLFEQFGPIVSSNIVKDFVTKESKGYGFVKYVRADDAARAVEQLDKLPVYNKILRVGYSKNNPVTGVEPKARNSPPPAYQEMSEHELILIPIAPVGSFGSIEVRFLQWIG